MADNIVITKNHFYKKAIPSADAGLNSAYSDLTAGTTTTANIKTGPDYSILLAGAVAPTVPDYGSGELSELWGNFYVNSFKTENSVIPAVVKLYGLNDSATITEGGQVLSAQAVSGTRIDAFTSYLDYNTPWMEENFDQVNKGYGDIENYSKSVTQITGINYEASFGMFRNLLEHKGLYTAGKQVIGAFLNPSAGREFAKGDKADELHKLKRITDGTYAGMYRFPVKADLWGHGDMWASDEMTTFPAGDWVWAGAQIESAALTKTYNQFDTEFIDTLTQHNSIFTYVRESRDIEDIKVQTVGTAGDDDKFYTYSRITFDPKEKLTGENSAHFMNFWENYSGSTARSVNADGLYPMAFGYSNTAATPRTPMPQFNTAVMDHFPIPVPLDIAALSGSNLSAMTNSATSQYIEIPLKFEKLPQVLKTVDTAGGSATASKLTFDRGFWIIFGNKPPETDDNFNSYITRLRATTQAEGKGWCGLWFFYENEGDEDITVISFNEHIGGSTSPFMTSASDSVKLHSTQTGSAAFSALNKTTIPVNDWQTLRIKFKSGQTATDTGKLLAYFPSALDSTGTIKNIQMDMKNTDEGADADIWNLKTMSFWSNNFRAIVADGATSGGASADNSINYNLKADGAGFNDQDKYSSVFVDAIRLYGYNNTVANASVNTNNSNRTLTIPSNVAYPPCSGNAFGVSGSAEGDNYYLSNNALGQINICVGVDGPIASRSINPYTNNLNYFLLNQFTTSDEQSIDSIPNRMIKLQPQYSGGAIRIGDTSSYSALYNAGSFPGSDANTNTKLYMRDGAYFNDNLKQKGLFAVSGLTNTGGVGGLIKRENPYVAARIIQVSPDGNEITVDNPNIFDLPIGHPSQGGSEYVIWSCGAQNYFDNEQFPSVRTIKKAQEGTGSIGFGYKTPNGVAAGGKAALPLYQVTQRAGSTITLNRSVKVDDANEESMAMTVISGAAVGPSPYQNRANINQIMISPKKFWFNVILSNASGSVLSSVDMRHFGSGYFPLVGTSLAAQFPAESFTQSLGATRSYGPMNMVLSSSASFNNLGTTFNEYKATDGAYFNRWNLKPVNDSIVDVNIDYGYGVYTEAGEDTLPVYAGYINKTPVVSGANYINLTAYVNQTSPEFGSTFNFGIYPFEHRSGIQDNYEINFNTKDAASNKLQTIWGLHDKPPKKPNLSVTSAVDFLGLEQTGRMGSSSDINLYDVTKGDLPNNLKFTWDESDEDIWYRLLFVDSEIINNKYHSINFWAPLNEDSSTHGYYTSAADTSPTNFAGTVAQDIEGFSGWGAKFNGAALLSSSAATVVLGDTSQFTFIAHAIPSTAAGAIFTASSTAAPQSFNVSLSGNKVVGKINNAAAKVISRSSYECDGVQPLAIILTYNKNELDNNLKLYVNNRLEDTADYTAAFNNTGTVSIGAERGSTPNYFTGFIEEITFHKKLAYVSTDSQQYYLNNTLLPDVSGTNSLFYQGKLFLMDYHNIRGKSSQDVTESNLASWKSTGLT